MKDVTKFVKKVVMKFGFLHVLPSRFTVTNYFHDLSSRLS